MTGLIGCLMWFNKVINSDVSSELYCGCSFNGFSNELKIGYWPVIFSIRSKLAFLSRGLTKASLRLSRKIPEINDLLIISVNIVITDGRIFLIV